MDLTLKRTDYTEDGVFGHLEETDSGDSVAVTLEHAYYSGNGIGSYEPKLPPGEYLCVRGTHQLKNGKPFVTFQITGVPNHTGMLFHPGNYNEDSDGCVLLGTVMSSAMISESRVAFTKFMSLQEDVDAFPLTVLA